FIVLCDNGEEAYVTNVIEAGINGYLLKNMDIYSFIDAIKFVSTGNNYIHYSASNHLVKAYRKLIKKEEEVTIHLHLFTKRECEVLQLLTDVQSNRRIGERMSISEKTVKNNASSQYQ